jgi:hypothetical protein
MKPTLKILCVLCAWWQVLPGPLICVAGPWTFTFTPSPSDDGSNGVYQLFWEQLNDTNYPQALNPITNTASGSTNFSVSLGGSVPIPNPCFLWLAFYTSASGITNPVPLYFDTNAFNAPPLPPGPIKPVKPAK